MDETREHAGWVCGVGRDIEVEVLGLFVEGGGEASGVCVCNGEIHEVTIGVWEDEVVVVDEGVKE